MNNELSPITPGELPTLMIPDAPDKPHQPVNFTFPKCSFREKKAVMQSFQSCLFSWWTLLRYDEAKMARFENNNVARETQLLDIDVCAQRQD